jgi:DNA-binding CsgD family transcriptional regulator
MTRAPRSDDLTTLPLPARGLRIHAMDDGAILVAFDVAPAACVPQLETLPPAQRRVVELALAGLSDKAIAAHLGRSRHTISNQLRRAYAKLGVNSRNELSARLRG